MNLFTKQRRALLLAAVVVVAVCVSNVAAQGTFTDKRDGKTYKTVAIGGKTWLGENLNYQIGKSVCYENSNSNCDKYGRLYDWNTAKKACPAGWHLPTAKEWDNMLLAAGLKKVMVSDVEEAIPMWGGATKLMAKTGWPTMTVDFEEVNGTDDHGFTALPGGNLAPNGFFGVDESAYWWTATECGKGNARTQETYNAYMRMDWCEGTNDGYSVRCIQD